MSTTLVPKVPGKYRKPVLFVCKYPNNCTIIRGPFREKQTIADLIVLFSQPENTLTLYTLSKVLKEPT